MPTPLRRKPQAPQTKDHSFPRQTRAKQPIILPQRGTLLPQGVFANPVINHARGHDHGDPFVLHYLGHYYLYHTGKDGVYLYTSTDLVNWQAEGTVLAAGPAGHWAQTDFWAPEVLYQDGVFYMYVAATLKKPSGKGDDRQRRLGLARALDPRGPFVWDQGPLVGWEWSIDGHPYRDEDGLLWMFYNIRTPATRYPDGTTGCGNVVGRMTAPDRLDTAQTPVAFPSHRWEGDRKGSWYWNEGPFVLKRRGVYYQMYSGGCFQDETYGLGYATASHPSGPWHKQSPEPILRSSANILGPGHHCIVAGPDGVTPYAVYHGYLPRQKGRKVHLDRFFWVGDRLTIAGPTHAEQPLPPGPLYDPAVPHWNFSAWVFGRELRVGGVSLPLSLEGYQHLRVIRQGQQFKVYLGGVLRWQGLSALEDLEVEGEIRDALKTSWLDDEQLYTLAQGEQQSWAWGGVGALEVALAVRGHARVRVGSEEREVKTQGYELIRLWADGGAQALEVTALEGGATVTDVVLTARSL